MMYVVVSSFLSAALPTVDSVLITYINNNQAELPVFVFLVSRAVKPLYLVMLGDLSSWAACMVMYCIYSK